VLSAGSLSTETNFGDLFDSWFDKALTSLSLSLSGDLGTMASQTQTEVCSFAVA
jgi:hypothetical protein